jgi:outer membrane receptor protein involved in Fe transport
MPKHEPEGLRIKKMRRQTLIIFMALALGFSVLVYGKTNPENRPNGPVVRGVVQDIHHRTLEGIKVSVKNQNIISFTSSRGEFVLQIPSGISTITLIFEHARVHTNSLKVKIPRVGKSLSVMLIPKEYIQEEISVTALNREERTVNVPAAESMVSELEIQEKIPENIVDTLLNTPGIYFIGSGGFSITPSIRGVARRRVLMLVDGMRITGDRRAGVSAELIAPELVEKIETVRSASSVLYGSDAMGGVIQLLTANPEPGRSFRNNLNFSVNANDERLNGGLAVEQKIGGFDLNTAFQVTKAGNYSTPDEEIYHSGYTYYSGILGLSRENDKRRFILSYIGGIGNDIGKPNRENLPDTFTRVSDEGEHYIRFQYTEKQIARKSSLDLLVYLNPSLYALEKFNAESLVTEFSRTQGLNLGGKATFKTELNKNLSFQTGLEWFGRRGFDFENTVEEDGVRDTTFPLRDGRRDDLGLFLTADYCGIRTVDIMGGIRYTWFSIKALVDEESKERNADAPSYFLGLTKKFGEKVSWFFTLGKAYRLPGMSELFYTGLTGRKYVIGNPDLIPESSFNLDTGIKLYSKKFFLGAYFFSYRIDDMIERYKNDEGIYTYDNISRGNITGGEVEFQFFPTRNLELFGHYTRYHGRSAGTDEPLNDIPSAQLFLGVKLLVDRFWLEINYIHSYKKGDPGPAEVENEAYKLLNLKAGYYFSSRFTLNLKIANFLNEPYTPNPDPDIPRAKGLDLSLGLHYYF